jgi:hypothetical protein
MSRVVHHTTIEPYLRKDEVENQVRQGPDFRVPVVGDNQANVADIAAIFLIKESRFLELGRTRQ